MLVALGSGLSALTESVLTPTVASAAVSSGNAEITNPGLLTSLRSGRSTTLFGVALPQGASCPGDTAHKGYHVYSYLVPQGVSPSAVSFTNIPSRGYGYFAYGAYVGPLNTAENTGEVIGLPAQFSWSRLTPKELFRPGTTTATWEGGIACANTHGVMTNYWHMTIVFKAGGSDVGGFTWSTATSVPTSSGPGLGLGIALLVVAVALAGLAFRLRRRAGERRHVDH